MQTAPCLRLRCHSALHFHNPYVSSARPRCGAYDNAAALPLLLLLTGCRGCASAPAPAELGQPRQLPRPTHVAQLQVCLCRMQHLSVAQSNAGQCVAFVNALTNIDAHLCASLLVPIPCLLQRPRQADQCVPHQRHTHPCAASHGHQHCGEAAVVLLSWCGAGGRFEHTATFDALSLCPPGS